MVLAATAWGTGLLGPNWLTGSSATKRDQSIITDRAVKAPFLVSIPVQGSVDSRKNAVLSSNVEGSTTIIKIVPEGTLVKEGEVVCLLDSSALREKEKQQQITVTQAEAALAQARELLEIQKAQNESDISAAKLAWDLALLDFEKYEQGEYPQLFKQGSGAVALAQEELLRAQENQEFTREQVKKGYRTQNDLEATRIAVKQAELKLQGAEEELKVLSNYTQKRTMAELRAAARELELELGRVKLKATSAETQAAKDVEAKDLTYAIEKEKQETLIKQIEACTLKAPQPGEVVYANLSGSRRGSSESSTIEEGGMVRERQAIINLPDITQMKVSCRVHESLIKYVRKGLKARIRVDAWPDETFNGEVAQVASVPMTGSWPNTDLREYASEVNLTDDVEKVRKLRPGLTAQVEVLVDNRDNVLQVPIQAVVAVADKQVAYVLQNNVPERREIKMGQSNQSHVEILDGVSEGEEVILNPKSRFARELAELEAALNAEQAKQTANDPKAATPADVAPMPAPGIPGAPGAPGAGSPSGGPGGPGGAGPGGPGGPGAGGGAFNPSAFFERMDADKDGKLTGDEIHERMRDRVATMDKDKDGSITLEEFSSAPRPTGGPGGPGAGGPGGGGPGGGRPPQ